MAWSKDTYQLSECSCSTAMTNLQVTMSWKNQIMKHYI